MDKIRKHWLVASAGAIALWSSPGVAQTVSESEMAEDVMEATALRRNATYVDLTGSLGYSTNPMLRTLDSPSSVFGRASARGVHMWNGELSSTSLSAFVEGTTYFNEYGVKSIFSLTGDTQRQVSERVRLFGSAGVSGDIAGQLSNRFLYVPSLPDVPVESVRTRLSEYWDASAGIGVSFSDVERDGGSSNSTSLSFNGSICNTTEYDRFCGRVARYDNSSSRSALVTTTSAGIDWFRKLDEAQTIQLSASIVRYSTDGELVDSFETNHFRLAGSYSRRISGRLSAGADVGVRALRQEEGPDPDTDISASLFVRYRLGDLG